MSSNRPKENTMSEQTDTRYRITVQYDGPVRHGQAYYRDTLDAATTCATRLAGDDRVARVLRDRAYQVNRASIVVESRETQHDNYGRPYMNHNRGWSQVTRIEVAA
jgi:hypothetical protein